MKPEAQRIAIAEACGWTHKKSRSKSLGEYSVWMNEKLGIQYSSHCPDYLHDLNSIIGAIKDVILGNVDLEKAFVKHLNAILDRRADDDAGPVVCEYEMAQITAGADEFCEALLKTLGRWVEE